MCPQQQHHLQATGKPSSSSSDSLSQQRSQQLAFVGLGPTRGVPNGGQKTVLKDGPTEPEDGTQESSITHLGGKTPEELFTQERPPQSESWTENSMSTSQTDTVHQSLESERPPATGRIPRPDPTLRVCDKCPFSNCDECDVAHHPEYYRKAEKADKRKIWFWAIGAFLVVVVVAALSIFVYHWYQTSVETHTTVNKHNTAINQTETYVKAATGIDKDIREEGGAIEQYAKNLTRTVDQNHVLSVANQKYICSKTPGCDPALIK